MESVFWGISDPVYELYLSRWANYWPQHEEHHSHPLHPPTVWLARVANRTHPRPSARAQPYPAGKVEPTPTFFTRPLDRSTPLITSSRESTRQTPPDPAPGEAEPGPASLGTRLANLAVVVVPFAGLVAAAALLWGWGFSWVELGLLLGMYLLTGLGITVGFHRLFAHRSLQTGRVLRFALAALGSMAAQGPLLRWVALHRRHHQHSDRPGDPHSPHDHGRGLLGLLRGLWHAHLGWVFQPDPPNLARYAEDLRRDGVARLASALFLGWVALGLLLPALLGGLLTGTWAGALLGLLWGGLARIFLVHHVTWSVNSVCHLWGRQPFPGRDQSRNNLLFGILALGEGWHNNHHAFPTSARHGLRWWQFDLSYYVIRALALLGLAWEVRVPARQLVLAERQRRGEGAGSGP
jgi:stearoyl-CoA desaturase (Delta-9 desaturase)